MKNWFVVGVLSCLGVAPTAHAELTCYPAQLRRTDQALMDYQEVPAAGGASSIVAFGENCGWTITEDADMLVNLKTTTIGRNALSVSFTVLPNTGAARSAFIKSITAAKTATFEIRQEAAATVAPTPPAPGALSNDVTVLGAQRTCSRVAMTTVKSGATLKPDTYVLSPSRQYKLIYQTDGNLVLYRASGEFLWNNGKTNTGGKVVMQTDGNLVSYNAAGKALWGSLTSRNPGAFLGVQDDGNVVVYAVDSCKALWSIR